MIGLRRATTVVALIAAGAVLGGCAVFRVSPTALQAATIGDVTVHVSVCASNIGTCPAVGAGEADPSANQYDLQMLLGFLIPDGADAPASFDTSTGPAGSFARNDGYSSGLEAKSPAPAGSHWVGYATTSTYHWKGTANPATSFTADPAFHLRQGADGSPFAGPFAYRAVVGVRAVTAGHPATAPVDCINAPASTQTMCSEFVLGGAPYGEDLALATRDLGVVAPAAASTTTPGGSVSVPFVLRYSGPATPAADFALSSVSTIPGAAPTVSQPSLVPASDSDRSVLATVSVPPGTAPGSYTVSLSASLPNGQKRTATGTLDVVPVPVQDPPPPPSGDPPHDTKAPAARVTIGAAKLGALVKSRRLRLRATLDEPGSLILSAKLPGAAKPVRVTVAFVAAGAHAAVLHLSNATAKQLRHRSKLKLAVTATARDLAGNKSAAHASRTFKR